MKNFTLTFLFFLTLTTNFSQQNKKLALDLKTGTQYLPNNIDLYVTTQSKEECIEGKYYKYVQFNKIPSQGLKNKMIESGMKFQEYIPMNTYLVLFPENFNKNKLKSYGVRSVMSLKNSDRITPVDLYDYLNKNSLFLCSKN